MYSLKGLNTFGIDSYANEYIELASSDHIKYLIKSKLFTRDNYLIIGGGSNILFRGDFSGRIFKPVFNSIKTGVRTGNEIEIECDAGVVWDDFVEFCVSNNFGGAENLSYIPGNTGAAPIQNIGAYGIEVAGIIKEVKAIDLRTGEDLTFNNKECDFSYRNSIFKNKMKGEVIITSVTFKLSCNKHLYTTSYGSVDEKLRSIGETTLANLRRAIIEIRKEKLPEPKEIGNAGSFFKNPIISLDHFNKITNEFAEPPSYPAESDLIKIPAGWLVEKCGWKGYRKGDAGVHSKQALVLVNHGNASGNEIYQLSEDIIKSVSSKFGIELEREVNVILA